MRCIRIRWCCRQYTTACYFIQRFVSSIIAFLIKDKNYDPGDFIVNKHNMLSFVLFSIPTTIHWSILIILIYALPFSQNIYAYPLIIFFYLLLIIIHELGHAAFCKLLQHKVISIYIDFSGGKCYYADFSLSGAPASAPHHSIIAWGGIVFQIILFIISFILLYFMQRTGIQESNIFFIATLSVFIVLNALLIVFNLIPMRNNDGVYALKLFVHLYNNIKEIHFSKQRKPKFKINRKQQDKSKHIIAETMRKVTEKGWDSLSKKEKQKLEWARKHYNLEKIK
jgi:hypothetical protein